MALMERARYAKGVWLGLAESTHMYNIYCRPVLQHGAHFYQISKRALGVERLQQLPEAPRHYI
eukprot:3040054-Pyramimonas_sp.AAC.1